jgi:hypothetical protein
MADPCLRIPEIKVGGKTDRFAAISAAASAGERRAYPLTQKNAAAGEANRFGWVR